MIYFLNSVEFPHRLLSEKKSDKNTVGSCPTVGHDRGKRLQPAPLSGQRAMSLPTEINGFTKRQIKHDRKCISLRYLI